MPKFQTSITNRLRELRIAAGMSQGDLAKNVGITRQALYAMEKNQYLPGTELALRLARVLQTSVEDLFSLDNGYEIIEAELLAGRRDAVQGARVKLATIGKRMIAKPVADLGDVLNYTIAADGLMLGTKSGRSRMTDATRAVYVQLLQNRKDVEKQIVVAGCDPAMYLMGEHVRRQEGRASVVGWTMGSLAALYALKRGEVHVAGIHMMDHRSGDYNSPFLKRYLKGQNLTVIRFAAWQEGLLLRRGNPKKIQNVDALSKSNIRIINREKGSGSRLLLDYLLSRHRIPREIVRGYGTTAFSQIVLGRTIAEGKADVGIGAQAVAQLYDLDFIPLQEERYDFVIPTKYLHSHPSMNMFLDTLVTRGFRREIEALGGYDTKDIGKIIE